ncbi:MAG TPA: YkgJ family cysteine cluster protein [Tepidisphaeraceae bacterium]|nr:YkgJ family cysteine cluster protein [Tepidisphaeraceae bacterium]
MKLPVLEKTAADDPWYAQGLNFTCTQCGNCCTGAPGYVWISRAEIALLAEHLKMTGEDVVERYCRKIDGKFSLKERRSPAGLYDCIFLKETKAPRRDGGDDNVVHTIRACTVYPVRPLQCRTWPFWPENLSSKQAWDHAAQRCHGMNARGRTFSINQIHAVRDAAEWPKNPPTSATPSPQRTQPSKKK